MANVLNKVKRRTRIFREIAELAPSLGLRVTQSSVRDLQAFPEADQRGTVVLRMKPDNVTVRNARTDLSNLFREILIQKEEQIANG